MKIFEFSFNPKKRKDRFFELFSYEPKSLKEKSKGSIYIVGELSNALEFNSRFLRRLSETIQREYYDSSLKGSVSALKAALKKANGFLTEVSQKGNVDWLGNLHLAILLFITVKEKKTIFHVAKTGNIKVLLARQNRLIDVGKNLETGSFKQPGKVFGNLVSGTLVPGDSFLAESKEIFDVLSKDHSLQELGALKEAKQFREFFSRRKSMLSLSSGVLVSFVIEEEQPKRSLASKSLFPSFPKPKLMLPKGVKVPTPNLKLKLPWVRHHSAFKKQVILILLFSALLLLGYLSF